MNDTLFRGFRAPLERTKKRVRFCYLDAICIMGLVSITPTIFCRCGLFRSVDIRKGVSGERLYPSYRTTFSAKTRAVTTASEFKQAKQYLIIDPAAIKEHLYFSSLSWTVWIVVSQSDGTGKCVLQYFWSMANRWPA